jgi:hypothetical protein
MKQLLLVIVMISGLAVSGYAQQDPDDPGVQDSVIMGEVIFNPADTMFYFPVYAVCDDSVAFYNIPLRWVAPYGGITAAGGNEYFTPLNEWDDNFDTVMLSQSYIRQFGFADLGGDDNTSLYSISRINIFNIPFRVDPDARRQLIVVDTVWDQLNGSLLLGLSDGSTEITPAFKRGFIYPDAIDDIPEPSRFSLSQNYPNPFNSATEIEFSLPRSGLVSLVIYDIQGREVRRLLEGSSSAGRQKIIWDGTDNNRGEAASGIYFYRLTTDNMEESRRMTLLR